ncbi:MAG: Phosphopantothenoylcysteine decarboxylase / Phosphopantothenoylcysteine synthetase [Firmicutes bacterium]|nr:Phosphopantothenoylcysteine decarboxylase / Phosphopantothenoylcysteine synthetase [Bacillota bacterium]MDI6705470.1 bifunctional phosphopantothenoylcysteine decarboxylase/phosphopantothenate--cysteine ligase CoaBC [Bacillota bacterium]
MLSDKKIVLGVCGGIAAYKCADLVSRLVKEGAKVKVVMTKSAQEFITPLTFQTLSNNRVITDLFAEPQNWEVEHISLAQWADCLVIAPATANVIGKLAAGIADDMLTTVVAATKAKVIIAPAMNTNMYNNRIVRKNIDYLIDMGYLFISPAEGRLACGDEGLGRLEEPGNIVEFIKRVFDKGEDLKGKTVLVTAGPTREIIDPVRFITNGSSGKMGYAVAEAAVEQGAKVILVSGPTTLTPPQGVELVKVTSAREMYEKVMEYFPLCDIVIKAAAVSDYRPVNVSSQKIKKTHDNLEIKLERNPDILYELGKLKTKQILVGFAAESTNIFEYAKEKLEKKNLDLIVANDITRDETGFSSDTNAGFIMDRDFSMENIPKMSKHQMADVILEKVKQLIK